MSNGRDTTFEGRTHANGRTDGRTGPTNGRTERTNEWTNRQTEATDGRAHAPAKPNGINSSLSHLKLQTFRTTLIMIIESTQEQE